MSSTNIVAISGSMRVDSVNTRIIDIMSDHISSSGDYDVSVVNLKDCNFPLYNGDDESKLGLPKVVLDLQNKMIACKGIIISSPEYNGSISGVLKNFLDWLSRPQSKNSPSCQAFSKKIVAISSASPGKLGGIRGIFHVRDIMINMGSIVMPESLSLGSTTSLDEEKITYIKGYSDRYITMLESVK